MNYNIITIFPGMFDSYFNESIIKRAQDKGIINIKTHALRDYTTDKHKTVDDTPYSGGAGMVMMIEPLYKALESVKSEIKTPKSRTILLSAKGRRWTQQVAQEFAELENITMICGRYEGVDQRILEFIDEEISIGDFVLTGGEIGAMTIVDSVTRLLPGVLGNEFSAIDESHSIPGVLEYPQYTKPEIFKVGNKEYTVPEILLSGNHKKIQEWRENMKKKKPSNN
ncbi:tRNA (guanosine(37)-N1)-methyltransferase TrmD [Candidatus Parcubacteria bacterium]|nr:tRNA (guanosine(37)-N1)-methyltransferase TrmD [Patescibacteria group bacterium]MBU4309566.1 tRNA (guanosine(37)-N1)-methyltransferase TrmD [Patescibacteria group bacterium]MBU4432507.1 tRNA (guanosine(37)-N1)-methyltransferase TrmD [Patescibacteria group bacterium]MBU4578046.1 tRNA (guanosine(37)-N1)-methyltransferase TrmD [Patescibacteria group bacterium]MCG2696446.1 tRNA (guanosine(37)-N1)-methyltransferase TrmD [Candidatus Parcubacteria bacterium]